MVQNGQLRSAAKGLTMSRLHLSQIVCILGILIVGFSIDQCMRVNKSIKGYQIASLKIALDNHEEPKDRSMYHELLGATRRLPIVVAVGAATIGLAVIVSREKPLDTLLDQFLLMGLLLLILVAGAM